MVSRHLSQGVEGAEGLYCSIAGFVHTVRRDCGLHYGMQGLR